MMALYNILVVGKQKNDFIAPENMCDRFTINHPDKAVSMATNLFKTLSNY